MVEKASWSAQSLQLFYIFQHDVAVGIHLPEIQIFILSIVISGIDVYRSSFALVASQGTNEISPEIDW